jgi:hypothetical protein
MKEDEMRQIADMLDKVVMNFDKEDVIKQVKYEVKELTSRFPLYKEFDATVLLVIKINQRINPLVFYLK